MVEPVDLTQARRVHRQRLRDESTHVVKVLPDNDDELSRAVSELEEVRLLIAGEELDEVGEGLPLDAATGGRCRPPGRLRGRLGTPGGQGSAGGAGRHLCPRPPALRKHRPHGSEPYRDGRRRARWPLGALGGRRLRRGPQYWDWPGRGRQAPCGITSAASMGSTMSTPSTPVSLAPAALQADGVELTLEEHAPSVRVTERILTTWHGNSPLERYMYGGWFGVGALPARVPGERQCCCKLHEQLPIVAERLERSVREASWNSDSWPGPLRQLRRRGTATLDAPREVHHGAH